MCPLTRCAHSFGVAFGNLSPFGRLWLISPDSGLTQGHLFARVRKKDRQWAKKKHDALDVCFFCILFLQLIGEIATVHYIKPPACM